MFCPPALLLEGAMERERHPEQTQANECTGEIPAVSYVLSTDSLRTRQKYGRDDVNASNMCSSQRRGASAMRDGRDKI
jgi:hypothetical protein